MADNIASPRGSGADLDKSRSDAAESELLHAHVRAKWANALLHDRFDDDDNFFDLGGNSLMIAEIVANLGVLLGDRVSPRLFFDNPTVTRLSKALASRPGFRVTSAMEIHPSTSVTTYESHVNQPVHPYGGVDAGVDLTPDPLPGTTQAPGQNNVASGCNQTVRPFAFEQTIPGLLKAAAQRYPHHPALVTSESQVMSHIELDSRSNQLANLLCKIGINRDATVALLGGRTASAIVGLLAVLKCGASYVPIDPAWPISRTIDLLSQLQVESVITDRANLSLVQELRWTTSIHHVLCPDIKEELTWSSSFQPDLVANFFDFVADAPGIVEAAGFNLRSSEISYNESDVVAYRDYVASFALASTTKTLPSILEIGSGSGLLVEALGPRASRYVAVDPSPVSVLRSQNSSPGVEGEVCFAHEVANRVVGVFDIILLASTVQFFPDLEYLIDVIESLTELLTKDGVIILSDLADPDFDATSRLRVSPDFIHNLSNIIPAIESVRVQRRDPGALAGELSNRYDAVITISSKRNAEIGSREPIWTGYHVDLCSTGPLYEGPKAADVCYTIFTSGSTGTPKGVVVTHRSAVNLFDWLNRVCEVGPSDSILFITSFCFDLSVYDIFGVLAAGGSVRMVSATDVADPNVLADLLERENITIWDSAPAALTSVMPFLRTRSPVGRNTLRLVLLSGDWIPVLLPDQVREAFPRTEVLALGGATECTVWSNYFRVGEVDPSWPSIPYGKPIQNTRYYVLDHRLRACDTENTGDLYIAGECVALGYTGRPSLTAGRFLPDISGRPGGRMYRTGDRARWLPTGELEFLGRNDDQIKLRGYRIELGEVQSAFLRCTGVQAAAVIAPNGPGGRTLAAFYVPTGDVLPKIELTTALEQILPTYMIPGRIIALKELPLTATGKIDRDNLASQLNQHKETNRL